MNAHFVIIIRISHNTHDLNEKVHQRVVENAVMETIASGSHPRYAEPLHSVPADNESRWRTQRLASAYVAAMKPSWDDDCVSNE
mgnify:CR=1 FL=1